MKRKVLACVAVAVSLLLGGAMVTAGEFYVSPSGKDTNPGTKDSPFQTIQKAKDSIRTQKASGKSEKWTVHLDEGEYPVREMIVFDAKDSGTSLFPVCYKGVEGKTIVTGGIDLTGWKEENGVWVANVPKLDGTTPWFEQLFVNGRRAVRARHPNKGFFKPEAVKEEFPMDRKTRRATKPATKQEIVAKPGDLDFLKNVPASELKYGQFIIHHHWDTTRRILLGYNPETRTLEMKGGPMKAWNPWRTSSLYYIENVRSAFDEPGEWFYDGAAGKVYYRPLPGETIAKSRVIFPRPNLIQLLKIEGGVKPEENVSSLRLEGISFRYTDTPRREEVMKKVALDVAVTGPLDASGPSQFEPAQSASFTLAVVYIDNARDIEMKRCSVEHIGEYGIWIKNGTKCRIQQCLFRDLGAGGVRLGGGNSTTQNMINNCIIQQGGRFHASATAVWIGNNTEDNRVTHNDIGDFFYTGVSAGWTWGYKGGVAFRNRIEFNKIHKIGQGALADMGGVYTLGTSTGTRVCDNVIYNVKSFGYGGWGLYTDEGSEGILMENNLVYDTMDGSFHQHYGKENTIRNNILVRSIANPAQPDKPRQVAITRKEEHLSITFENNIIYWDNGSAIGGNVDKAKTNIRSNLWWNTSGEALFGTKTHQQWQESGKDIGGLVADPLFVDPSKNDYRLKKGSPALKLGFVPFDYTRAGVYGSEAWKRLAAECP